MGTPPMATWPDDADGDVLRRMEKGGFDLGKATLIDFNVDFEAWPPPDEAIAVLRRSFPNLVVYPSSESGGGYIQFQLFDELSYELVMRIQADVTEWMAPFGGLCESWGVLH